GLERAWPARLTITNAALLLCVLPVPSMVRVVCSVLLLVMLLYFLVLLLLTVVRGIRNRRKGTTAEPAPRPAPAAAHRVLGGVALGLAVVMLAVAGGGAADVRSLPVLERSAATGA